jgi:hypothetical protein
MTASATAKARGIPNNPSLDVLANLRRLALELEKVRELCGMVPLKLHSCYRSPVLNGVVGGAKNSYHMLGLAADFDPPDGMTHDQLQHAIGAEPSIEFDKVLEEQAGDGAHWLHFQIPKDGTVGRRLLQDAALDKQGGAITRVTAG